MSGGAGWETWVTLVLAVLAAGAQAVAWLSSSARRRAERQKVEGDTDKAEADTIKSLAEAARLMIDPLRSQLQAEVSTRAELQDQVGRLRGELELVRHALRERDRERVQELAERDRRLQELEARVQELAPYEARVQELEQKCIRYEAELAGARDREERLQRKLERIGAAIDIDTGPLGDP